MFEVSHTLQSNQSKLNGVSFRCGRSKPWPQEGQTTMNKHTIKVSAAAAALLALTLGACSSGGASATRNGSVPEATPTVSTPAESPSAPSESNFSNALEFTRMTHFDKYGPAAALAAPESPAARYLAHQEATNKAQQINGDDTTNTAEDDYAFDADPDAGTIKIDTGDGETVYTWKDFSYDPRKIVSWTGASGPVAKCCGARSPRTPRLAPRRA